MTSNSKPLARSKELVVEELGEELLVYDQRVDRAHNLSPAVARVWSRCDGSTPAEGLSAQLGLDAETVGRALAELDSCDLLEAAGEGTTRREVTVRMAKVGAAAAAIPLIASVAAPRPAQAVTLAFCRQFANTGTSEGCGDCQQNGCCCCAPEGGVAKDCVPDAATCCALHPDAVTSAGCANPGGNCVGTTPPGSAPRLAAPLVRTRRKF